MKGTINLFFKMIALSFRSQMQYRASFIMLSLTHFISTFVDIIGIWVLFDRFKMVRGWTLGEVVLLYGIIQMGFAVAEASARGFDKFSEIVKNGNFDRLLLRPCGTLLQVATREFQLMRIGRFLKWLTVLIWACINLQLQFLSWKGLVILFAIIGTTSLFYGLFILQAALCFWTTETLELMNIATYGGVESGQYPMSIYNKGFRLFFTFVIPLACVAYYPIATLLKLETVSFWFGILAPGFGLLFLFLSCQVWKIGVHHYHSTGS